MAAGEAPCQHQWAGQQDKGNVMAPGLILQHRHQQNQQGHGCESQGGANPDCRLIAPPAPQDYADAIGHQALGEARANRGGLQPDRQTAIGGGEPAQRRGQGQQQRGQNAGWQSPQDQGMDQIGGQFDQDRPGGIVDWIERIVADYRDQKHVGRHDFQGLDMIVQHQPDDRRAQQCAQRHERP